MNRLITLAAVLLACMPIVAKANAPSYPPLQAYMMDRGTEIALARSAAPDNVSQNATIKVLTASGYVTAVSGTNGFVCEVMRGWAAPSFTPAQFRNLVYVPAVRAPICFDPKAAKEVMPYYELRTKLGMKRETPDQIAQHVQHANASGELPKRTGVSFAYMWSAQQNLIPGVVSHWHPHMMVFAPYYTNQMIGGNPFGSPLPQLSDDAGTPFAVVVIPVDMSNFVQTKLSKR